MSYLSDTNAHFGALQPITIDTAARLAQAANAGEAAIKIQNLNVYVVDASTGVAINPQSITSTVSQVLATPHAAHAKNQPAYLVHVSGWLQSFPSDGILISGGFPSSTTPATRISPKYVDASIDTYLNAGSTLTVYPTAIIAGSTPEVYFLEGGDVSLVNSVVNGVAVSMWAVTLDGTYIQTTGRFNFELSFNLFLQ